ncbi:hypothetical protein ACHAXN_007234 [Cyclotella atomus]
MAASAANKADSSPPSPHVILVIYVVLGCIISFSCGRTPGTLPTNIAKELAPSLIAICIFLSTYSTYDVMGVGIAKGKYKYGEKKYEDLLTQMPEEVYLAQRAQTNQVEQMTAFVFGSLSCAFFVNGIVAGAMSLIWVVLRRGYASAYRKAVGVPVSQIGLAKYTIAAYFMSNGMVMATAVHAVRSFISDN